LPYIQYKHLETCFHRSFSVIDLTFLDETPAGSKTGTVRATLSNLVALATSLHLEMKQRILTKKKAADLVYELDKLTDLDHCIPPLDALAGPAGARRPKRKANSAPKRVFKFLKEDGSSVDVEAGGGLRC